MARNPRRLIHVPIIHSVADLGAPARRFGNAFIERFGRTRWRQQADLANDFWPAVRRALAQTPLDYRRVDLYQDGLPVCGMELQLVEQAAAGGSENHRLLLDLVARGATLIGTEDLTLVLKGYRDIKASLAHGGAEKALAAMSGKAPRHAGTLARRDAFIASRIGLTLKPGRFGVLFLGLIHDIGPHLPPDIRVSVIRAHFSASPKSAWRTRASARGVPPVR